MEQGRSDAREDKKPSSEIDPCQRWASLDTELGLREEDLRKREEILLKREERLSRKESHAQREAELLLKKQELLQRREEMLVQAQLSPVDKCSSNPVIESKHPPSSSSPTPPSASTNGSLLSILTYADKYDRLLMVLGFFGAVGDGISLPATMLLMSRLIDTFGKGSTSLPSSPFMDKITKYCLYFVYVGLAVLAACFLEAAAWIKTGERQASRLRTLYLKAILRQDEGFFDMQGADTAEVVNSVAEDTLTIQEVICEKVPHFIMHLTTFVASYVVGFHLASQLAAVSLAFLPLLLIPGLMYGRILAGLSKKMHTEYLKAGSVAEQSLSSIRTVYSFVGESMTMRQFSDKLDGTVKLGLKQGLAKGLAVGSNGLTFAIWAFMAWYGSHLVMYHGYNGGRVAATGLSALLGGLALGNALPNLKYFSEASVAASHILKMIHRVPAIDPDDDSGKILETVLGHVEFRNVKFVYPARPRNTIFEKLSLVIPAGKTMALVGGSGSGKSTVISLMERFYDPLAGEILLDGVNIKLIQLKWMRQQIGLVSQEPALFATSIRENILLAKEDATMEDIIAAAKKANAHNFISQLPNAYETQVGERGVQMSGGQKQRIAIARAMLKDPPVLLLDEATSALDAESERVVQEALDSAALGRTTVVVAHRLTTIRNANCITVLEGGEVMELGQHEELLQRGGYYAMLINAAIGHDVVTMQEEEEEERRSSNMGASGSSFHSRPSSVSRPSFTSCGQSGQLGGEDNALEVQEQADPPSLHRLVALNKPEWMQATLGSLGAAGFGVIQPLYAFTLGSMITAFYIKDHSQQSRRILKYSLSFVALAVASFLTNVVQHYNFAAMGEHLTKRVRERMLRNILTFEVGWFDEAENSSGAICGRLASSATVVRSLVGDRWSLIVTTFVAVVAAWSFGLVISWRLAIVIIAVQPLVILCFYTRRVLIKKMSEQALHMQQHSSHLAAEAVAHHRTIAAFSSQSIVIRLFNDLQEQSRSAATRQALIGGLGLGAAQITMFLSWALDFWYGGYLLNKGHLTPSAMFKTFFILVSTGRVIADAGSMTSDIAKGAAAVASVFGILDRISRINPDDPEAQTLDSVKGDVELHHVDFAYPSRPDIMVFRNFNLRVRAGQSVALVGHSGSGKSTVIGLIERFYDPLKGSVKIDGVDIRKLHLRWLRRHVALVGQEPTLFVGTIRENILYGKEDATETEVVEATKAANAHDFVSALADGYETSVGERGVQLSGGQKQRIAIARAIIRAPAILLLDEATSALDAQSEKVVQDALDGVMVGRTTLVVAHRLSTIQNCHSIAVVQDGTVVESGNHADLLANAPTGAYFNLVRLQQQPSPPGSSSLTH